MADSTAMAQRDKPRRRGGRGGNALQVWHLGGDAIHSARKGLFQRNGTGSAWAFGYALGMTEVKQTTTCTSA
jgi:hypothetical protein